MRIVSQVAWIAGLAITFAVTFIAFAIPIMMDDGTNNLSGLEKGAALHAKQEAKMNVHGIDKISTPYVAVHVDAVYATPFSEANGWCGYPTGDDTQGHYSVTVSYRTIFGISIRQYTAKNCAPPFAFRDESTGKLETVQ